jgi:hypothetical protein
VLIGLLVAAARVTVDGHVALAELVDDDTPPPNDRAL